MAEADSRASLRHILADDDDDERLQRRSATTPPQAVQVTRPSSKEEGDEEKDVEEHQYTATTQSTRRNANGSVSSVFSGNKMRHLKKDDGVPLWRKDIQYDFLELIFSDTNRVFTCFSDKTPNHTFSEIYIDAMTKSSKTSRILKEKLAQDHDSAVSMAMVCLLVNVGRMNTTLNFFPEMRAQLRTYHAVPALQARQDPGAYKQLQDAPRLKSILKGASEDEPQPNTMEEVRKASKPRTNPVNLIFILSQYAPKISEIHFTPPIDFFDLVMRPTLSSKSRARAFLWLLWWYLESDFTEADSERNPFGAGQKIAEPEGDVYKVPALEFLTEAQAALENIDPDYEVQFGETKRKERMAIVSSEPSPAMTALKRARKERGPTNGLMSDNDSIVSPGRDQDSPGPSAWNDSSRLDNDHSDQAQSPSPSMHSRSAAPATQVSKTTHKKDAAVVPSSDAKSKPTKARLRLSNRKATPLSDRQSVLNMRASPHSVPKIRTSGRSGKNAAILTNRDRPLTAHQAGMNEYRRARVQRVLNREIRAQQAASRRLRRSEGVLLRAWKLIKTLPADYDSEEEERRATHEPDEEGGMANGNAATSVVRSKAGIFSEAKSESFLAKKDAAVRDGTRPVGGVWMAGIAPADDGLFGLDPRNCSEDYRRFSRAFSRAQGLLKRNEEQASEALKEPGPLGQRKHDFDESRLDDTYEISAHLMEERSIIIGGQESGYGPAGKRGVRKSLGPSATAGASSGTTTTGPGQKSKGSSAADTGKGGKRKSGAAQTSKNKRVKLEGQDDMVVDGNLSSGRRGATATAAEDEEEDVDYDENTTAGDRDNVLAPVTGGRELDSEDRELLGEVDGEDEDEDDDDDDDDDGEAITNGHTLADEPRSEADGGANEEDEMAETREYDDGH